MARMTIAQLTDENIRLRAHCGALEAKVSDLEAAVRMAKAAAPAAQAPVRRAKPAPHLYRTYWEYVRAAKDWCHANRVPVSYKSREQYDTLCYEEARANEMEG